MIEGVTSELNLHFQPKQWEAFSTPATEVFYGGAAFGAKSHLLRLAAIQWCNEIPGLQVYFFRRVEDELVKNHMEGPNGFHNLLAPWVHSRHVEIVEKEIRFAWGSRIFLCHCKDERHRFRYHGDEIHVLMIDELTTFTELIYRYLRFRVRMVGINLPGQYRAGGVGVNGAVNEHDVFPRILCASNPGNTGHHWVKRTWGLDDVGIRAPTRMPDIEGGMVRQFIPSRLADNPIGTEADPTYVQRMRGLADKALVKAMEEGDWNILAGGFFPEFALGRHVLKSVKLPKDKFSRRFRASDWGSYRPFSTGWYGICDDDWQAEGTLGNTITVPRGALVRYREWYGKREGEDNRGLKLPVDRWAKGVLERTGEETDEPIRYDVVDPSMFIEDGGPSLAEIASKTVVSGRRMNIRPADNKRIPGWNQVRGRLQGDEGIDQPYIFLMDNQPDAIRIMQSVQHDELDPEDLDTDQEDHAVDEIRYASMSRPRAVAKPEPRKIKGPKPWTMEWIMQQRGNSPSVSHYPIE